MDTNGRRDRIGRFLRRAALLGVFWTPMLFAETVTLPVAASVSGSGGVPFVSDVRVFNTSYTDVVAVTAAISPYRSVRDEVRAKIDSFVEVFVDTPIEVCEERDVKGLYERARAGEIPGFTGVSDPYEPPVAPEVRVVTHDRDVSASAAQVIGYLEGVGLTGPAPRTEDAEARS